MVRVVPIAFLFAVFAARAAAAQDAALPIAPAPVDSASLNVVTTFSVKSGKIVLSSALHPQATYLPDGTYTNDGGLIFVIADGVISRLQQPTGEIIPIASVRKSRQGLITLTPATDALMQVSDIKLPSGVFRSEDGKSSITVVVGRPTAFTIAIPSPQQ